MKKFVRFLVALLLIVVVAVLALGMYEPKDIMVMRTAMIKAPKDVVFQQMVLFKNWADWSPWQKMDSAMKMTYYGTDGQPGSGYTWDGSDKTGAGEMKDSAINGTCMTYRITFTRPDRGAAWGDLKAEDSAGMTKATWTCNMHFPFPWNAALLFLDMDKMLGGDFASGLDNMKTYVESHAAMVAPAGVDIKEVDYPAHTFEGMHSTVSMADMMKYFDDAWSAMSQPEAKKINGPYCGIMYTWDTVQKNSDMMACFPVSDTTGKVKDASFVYVPVSKAVMAVQKGGYGRSMETHMAINKYLTDKGLTRSMVIEEYVVSKHDDPDSNKWVTNVYYLLK